MKKPQMPNIPEFSEQNYSIAGYVVGALVTLSGLFLIYEVLFNSDLTFSANWNMFKSPLGNVCWGVGFICAIIFWGKMGHWSATPVTEYRDSSGRLTKREENFDVMEQGFAKLLLPIIGHFGIEPIVYGAIIYYPLQCIIALVGAIFPYVLTLIVLAVIAGAWLFTHKCNFRYHSAVLVLLGLLFTVAFAWGGYALHNAQPGSTIQMLADTQGAQGDADFDEEVTADGSQTADGQQSEGSADAADDPGMDDEIDDQFEGVGEEGLMGSLPQGTTHYTGDMGGYPIEFSITRDDSRGQLTAFYKNVKYGATMNLTGESLPAMGGDISFIGQAGGSNWNFELTGSADHITGTAYGDGKQLNVNLRRK